MLAFALRVFERRHCVGGFARLRHQDRGAALPHGRLAVPHFGGDIDVDRDPRQLFQPVARHVARVEGRAAGRDRDARDLRKIERQLRQMDGALLRVEVGMQRVADHRRLLVDLLLHEMAEVALPTNAPEAAVSRISRSTIWPSASRTMARSWLISTQSPSSI